MEFSYFELMNALSTLAPFLVMSYHYFVANPGEPFWHRCTLAMYIGTIMHMPFSFFYHLLCAFNYFTDKINCVGRKLDQTFIHVNCVFLSFGISGSALYCAGSAVINAWYIVRLWLPGPHDNSFERRSNVTIATAYYTLPILMRGDFSCFFKAYVASFGVGALAFVFNRHLYGLGHTVFHFLVGRVAHIILVSASTAPQCLTAEQTCLM